MSDLPSPLISVIIPSYQRCNKLKIAIESVLAQTYNNFEVFIIDDGSTDGTKDILKQHYNKGNVILKRNEISLFKDNEPLLRNRLWEAIRSQANEDDWVIRKPFRCWH